MCPSAVPSGTPGAPSSLRHLLRRRFWLLHWHRQGWGRGVGILALPTLTIPHPSQELHTRLSEEMDRLRSFIASQGTGNGCGRSSERSSCELEVCPHPPTLCQAS